MCVNFLLSKSMTQICTIVCKSTLRISLKRVIIDHCIMFGPNVDSESRSSSTVTSLAFTYLNCVEKLE